jgi:tetratricopeptide (TPR) repeat protein
LFLIEKHLKVDENTSIIHCNIVDSFDDNEVKELTEAIDLLDIVWKSVSQKEQLARANIHLLELKSLAQIRTRKFDDAKSTLALGLKYQDENLNFLRLMAMLEYSTDGDIEEEIGYLTKAIKIFEENSGKHIAFGEELKLVLSHVYLSQNKYQEALDLSETVRQETVLESNREASWQLSILANSKLLNNNESVSRLCEEALELFTSSLTLKILCSQILTDCGKEEKAEELKQEIFQLLNNAKNLDLMNLGGMLFKQKRYLDTIKVYKELFNRVSNILEVHGNSLYCLIESYLHIGNFQEALNLSQRAITQGSQDKYFYDMASQILSENMAQFDKAIEISNQYLAIAPEDLHTKINRAIIYYKNHQIQELKDFLSQQIDYSTLDVHRRVNLIRLWRVCGFTDRALELAYDTRRRFFWNPIVHEQFAITCLAAQKVQVTESVVEDTVVYFSEKGSKDSVLKFYILEDSNDAGRLMHEINSSNPVCKVLLGKRVKDTFELGHGFTKQEYEIVKIQHKYKHAFDETSEQYNLMFPNEQNGFAVISVDNLIQLIQSPSTVDENLRNKRLRRLQLIEYYKKGLPLCSFATWQGKNIVETYFEVTSYQHDLALGLDWLGLKTCSNQYEVEVNTQVFHKAKNDSSQFLLDITALLTLQKLDLLELLVKHFGKPLVLYSTKKILNDYWIHQETLLAKVNDWCKARSEEVKNLESWIKGNTNLIETTQLDESLLNKSIDVYQRIFGDAYCDYLTEGTMRKNVLLLLDDGAMADICKQENSNLQRVFTASLLEYFYNEKVIDDNKYIASKLILLSLHYHFISISSDFLMLVLRQSSFEDSPNFRSALSGLMSRKCDDNQAIGVAVNFIKQLENENIHPMNRDPLIFRLLWHICFQRNRKTTFETLKSQYSQKSILQSNILYLTNQPNPNVQNVLEAMDTWYNSM